MGYIRVLYGGMEKYYRGNIFKSRDIKFFVLFFNCCEFIFYMYRIIYLAVLLASLLFFLYLSFIFSSFWILDESNNCINNDYYFFFFFS